MFRYGLSLLMVLLFCSGQRSLAITYYVSPAGNDTNNGTSLSSPFRTVQRALDVVNAGDQIYIRGGIYRERPRLRTSGASGQRILISAYANEVPIIDGSKEVGEWSLHEESIYRAQVLSIETIPGHPNYGNPVRVGHVILDLNKLTRVNSYEEMSVGSFYQSNDLSTLYVWTLNNDSPANHMVGIIKAFTSDKDWNEPSLFYSNVADHVTIRGLVFQHASGYGFFTHGSHQLVSHCVFRFTSGNGFTFSEGSDNEISDCEVYETVLENWPRNPSPTYPWGGALAIRGGSHGRVLRNRVHHNHGEGITLGGTHVPVYAASYMLVEDNIAHDNYSVQIYLHGVHHCRINRNLCYNTASSYSTTDMRTIPGITVGLESLHPEYGDLENDTLTNNFVINAHVGFGYFRDAPAGLKHFYVANNAFINCKWVCIWVDHGTHVGNIFRNNILYKTGWWDIIEVSDANDTIFDNNGFYNAEGDQIFVWNGVKYYSFNAWKNASGQGAASFFANPRFKNVIVTDVFSNFRFVDVDPSNYDLANNSPCRDAGQTIAFLHSDYWGLPRPQGTAFDMGAAEHPVSDFFAQIRAWLQGPFTGNRMRNTLSPLMPINSPYAEDPRTVTNIPANAVDWILLQLINTDGNTISANYSFFIREDGYLMDETGNNRIALTGIAEGDYYISLKHRNHLSVKSRSTIHVGPSATAFFDFTTSAHQYANMNSYWQLGNGQYALCGGDINADGWLTTRDYVLYYNQHHNHATGYTTADVNFDGEVDSQDYAIWLQNAQMGKNNHEL